MINQNISKLLHKSGLIHPCVLIASAIILLTAIPQKVYSQQTSILPRNSKDIAQEKEQAAKERKRVTSSAIYSQTQTRYQYRFGKIDSKGMIELMKRFDRSGNTVEEISYNTEDGTIFQRKTFRYDKNGNLVEENLLKADEIFKTVHRYSGTDKKYETVQYKSDGSIDKKITSIYDKYGYLLESIGYQNDGRLFLRESYLYDSRGNVSQQKSSLNNFLYSYDQRNNVKTIEKYTRVYSVTDSVKYQLTDRYEFQHDRTDNLLNMSHFKPDSSLRLRIDYLYDKDGKLIEEKEFNQDRKQVYFRKILYDNNGNISEEIGSDYRRKFRISSKYDSRGNLIEVTEFDQINEPKYTLKYTYGRIGSSKSVQKSEKNSGPDSPYPELDESIAVEEFEELLGGRLVAPDGAFLGIINSDTSSSQSIINTWGQYGFIDSPTSIFNSTIPYGGKDGVFSPFNPSSPSPPSIYKEGKFYTYFTENENFRPRSSPKKLIAYLRFLSNTK